MACLRKLDFLVLFLLNFCNLKNSVYGHQVPCFFIFGDSLADNGNNNLLNTSAKVNYPPYGVDFPLGATGRFSNGRNTVDIIAQLLGFSRFIPSYASAKGYNILQGLNYASGGSGIREETGENLGERISLNNQMKNHEKTISKINQLLGKPSLTKLLLKKCLYTIEIGSNDYLNNYFFPQYYNTSINYTPQQYAAALVEQYSQELIALYKYGARKVSLFGIGAIGCTPFSISLFGTNGSKCVDKMNFAIQIFNDQLKLLVDTLNKNLADASFVFIDVISLTSKLGTSSVPGVNGSMNECCQVNQFGLCIPQSSPCKNKSLNLFWDSFHPTEAVNIVTAFGSYTSVNPTDVYPIDIYTLAQL